MKEMCDKIPYLSIPRKIGRGERPNPSMDFTSVLKSIKYFSDFSKILKTDKSTEGIGVCTSARAGSDFMFSTISQLEMPASRTKVLTTRHPFYRKPCRIYS